MVTDVTITSQEDIQKLGLNFDDITFSPDFFCFKQRYQLTGAYLMVSHDGQAVAVVPINHNNRECSSVYKDYTRPHYLADSQIAVDWSQVARQLIKKYKFHLVQFSFVVSERDKTLQGIQLSPFSVFVLHLDAHDTIETVVQKFDKKTRNEVRKSQKFGFTVDHCGRESLDIVYDLYQRNMLRHKTPAKGRGFFEDLFRCYGDNLKVIAIHDGQKLIAANIFLHNDYYVKLLFNLSDPDYWPQCVNNLAYIKTIEFAINNHISNVDFGGALNTDHSHSHFKLGFGATQYPMFILTIGTVSSRLRALWLRKLHSARIRYNKIKSIIWD